MVKVKLFSDAAFSGFVDEVQDVLDPHNFYADDGSTTVEFVPEAWNAVSGDLLSMLADYGGQIIR